jgi:NAD(P)-dependent dehydrogenase (short-subunit alcohol dehydrogenase family)
MKGARHAESPLHSGCHRKAKESMGYRGFDLNGRTAVVIGGTSGIGRVIALGLAEAGADFQRHDERSRWIGSQRKLRVWGAALCGSRPMFSTVRPLNMHWNQPSQHSGKSTSWSTPLESQSAPTQNFPEDDWNRILETNLTGVLRACQVFGHHMLGTHPQHRIFVLVCGTL